MEISIRPAAASDADRAVPLVYSSGPDAFDYVFGRKGSGGALSFLDYAFRDGRGEFGYRNHAVAVADGNVVGVGAAYSGQTSLQFTRAIAAQIFRFYGLGGVGPTVRGLRTERVIAPPKEGVQYIAHLGVDPSVRGEGIGSLLIADFIARGRKEGHSSAELDVAVTNPRAQSLYERLGFEVVAEKRSSLTNEAGSVPGHRRMALWLI